MLNWDSLIPTNPPPDAAEVGQPETPAGHQENATSGHVQTSSPDTQAGHDLQEKAANLLNYCANVPVCPSEKRPVSHLDESDKSMNIKEKTARVPDVPDVPVILQGGRCSDLENSAHGGGAEVGNLASENEGSSVSYPLNPAAVCLVVAACKRSPRNLTPEDMGRHILSLHRLSPAEQVRHWHGVCLKQGLAPWRVLSFDSPGEGKDCGMCVHLDSILDHVEGDERRCYRWACKLGYLILEYGRATERIMLAPPECESYERFYPGAWR